MSEGGERAKTKNRKQIIKLNPLGLLNREQY
jgi:hypothetical protein